MRREASGGLVRLCREQLALHDGIQANEVKNRVTDGKSHARVFVALTGTTRRSWTNTSAVNDVAALGASPSPITNMTSPVFGCMFYKNE